MADAKIITYGELISATTDVIPDGVDPALLIEDTAGNDFIEADTANEKLILAGGGATVKIENASPSLVLDNTTPENADNGRESTISFTGVRALPGGEAHTLGYIRCSHHGSGTDDSGKFTLNLNNAGTPGDVLTIYRDGEMRLGGRLAALAGSYDNPAIKWDGDGNTGMYRPGTDIWAWSTNGSETMRLDGSGNLGIGEETPSKMLDVKNGASGGDILCYDIYTHDGGAETSDERQKENIVETVLGLDFVNSLEPVSYKWKDTPEIVESHTYPATDTDPERTDHQVYEAVTYTRTHHGLISQQVKQAVENAGLTDVDFAGYVYDPGRDEHRLRYTEFIAPLIKAVQELSARIEELENG